MPTNEPCLSIAGACFYEMGIRLQQVRWLITHLANDRTPRQYHRLICPVEGLGKAIVSLKQPFDTLAGTIRLPEATREEGHNLIEDSQKRLHGWTPGEGECQVPNEACMAFLDFESYVDGLAARSGFPDMVNWLRLGMEIANLVPSTEMGGKRRPAIRTSRGRWEWAWAHPGELRRLLKRLHVRLCDLLLESWGASRALQKFIDERLQPPGPGRDVKVLLFCWGWDIIEAGLERLLYRCQELHLRNVADFSTDSLPKIQPLALFEMGPIYLRLCTERMRPSPIEDECPALRANTTVDPSLTAHDGTTLSHTEVEGHQDDQSPRQNDPAAEAAEAGSNKKWWYDSPNELPAEFRSITHLTGNKHEFSEVIFPGRKGESDHRPLIKFLMRHKDIVRIVKMMRGQYELYFHETEQSRRDEMAGRLMKLRESASTNEPDMLKQEPLNQSEPKARKQERASKNKSKARKRR